MCLLPLSACFRSPVPCACSYVKEFTYTALQPLPEDKPDISDTERCCQFLLAGLPRLRRQWSFEQTHSWQALACASEGHLLRRS